jgi:hypothetical protein
MSLIYLNHPKRVLSALSDIVRYAKKGATRTKQQSCAETACGGLERQPQWELTACADGNSWPPLRGHFHDAERAKADRSLFCASNTKDRSARPDGAQPGALKHAVEARVTGEQWQGDS